MRRALEFRLVTALLSLPLLGSALILLSVPPLSRFVPAPVRAAIAPAVDALFALMARLPPDSLAGRAFFGSYERLVPWLGENALAAHSVLTVLPAVALLVGFSWWARRRKDRPTLALPGEAKPSSPKA